MCEVTGFSKISQEFELLSCEPVIRAPNSPIVINPLESLIPSLQGRLHYEFMLTICSGSTVVSN